MERKPYYVLGIKRSRYKLFDGCARDVYPNSGNGIQLYLTDDERDRYDADRVRNILEPYACVLEKRYMCIPTELILYAIEKVLYDDNEGVEDESRL